MNVVGAAVAYISWICADLHVPLETNTTDLHPHLHTHLHTLTPTPSDSIQPTTSPSNKFPLSDSPPFQTPLLPQKKTRQNRIMRPNDIPIDPALFASTIDPALTSPDQDPSIRFPPSEEAVSSPPHSLSLSLSPASPHPPFPPPPFNPSSTNF